MLQESPREILKSALVLSLAVAIAAPAALAQEEDIGPPGNHPRWRSMGGMPGTSGPVYCSALDPAGNLFIGGGFTISGDVRNHGVAKWDGTKWIGISPPLTTYGYTVESMAFDAQGNLYVGGSFRDIGGIPALRIAKWDGSQWHALGSGLGFDGTYASQSVKAIAVGPDGQVYAGGFFDKAGSITVNHIARWDGSQWHPLGDGLMDSSPSVNALAFDASGNLYATGKFQWANGTDTVVNHIAKWDGSAWSGLGSGLSGFPYAPVGKALQIDTAGDLVVAGTFKSAGSIQVNNIARWNGSQWFSVGPTASQTRPFDP